MGHELLEHALTSSVESSQVCVLLLLLPSGF